MRNHHDAKGPTLKTTRGRHLPRPYGRPTGWLRFVFAGLSPCANRDSLVGSRDTTPLGLLEMIGWSADVGKNAALGLPVQRAAFRPASSRRSVEVPVERQQEVAPL